MNPVPDIDHQAQIRHFQSINAANVTNMVNILLTLSVGVIAFAVNILVTANVPLGAVASGWIVASFVFLFLAAFVGITILFTRLEDYRQTILGSKMMRDKPAVITDEKLIKEVIALKKRADRLNLATNVLIYVQPALFMLGFVTLTIGVFIKYGTKLG